RVQLSERHCDGRATGSPQWESPCLRPARPGADARPVRDPARAHGGGADAGGPGWAAALPRRLPEGVAAAGAQGLFQPAALSAGAAAARPAPRPGRLHGGRVRPARDLGRAVKTGTAPKTAWAGSRAGPCRVPAGDGGFPSARPSFLLVMMAAMRVVP